MRKRKWLWLLGAGFAAGALVVVGAGPLVGQDAALTRAEAACEARGPLETKLAALEELADLDTSASRRSLARFAAGSDPVLASHALFTIGRADYSGARDTLRTIYENTRKPHAVRVAAFLALARAEIAGGASWSTMEAYGRRDCAEGSALDASILAARNALAPSTSTSGGGR